MATLRLTELQSKVAELVAEIPTFAGGHVLTDDGLQGEAMEAALNENGIVIVVAPVTSVRTVDQTTACGIVEAAIAVEVWENPEVNSQQAETDIIELLVSVSLAVITHEPERGEAGFKYADGHIELLASEPGLRGYSANFTKTVSLQ